MSVSSYFISYKHKVTWTIKNFIFHPRNTKTIISPKFNVACLEVIPMTFSLRTRRKTRTDYMEFGVSLHSTGNSNVCDHIANIKYRVYVSGRNRNRLCETDFSPEDYNPQSLAVDFIHVDSFEDETHLQNESLVVTCKLSVIVNHKKYQSSLYDKRLTSLCNWMADLKQHETRSDMLVYSKEKSVFKVHECILRARCPILFSSPGFVDQPEPVWITDLSYSSLSALLLYIYGGVKIAIPISIKPSLISAAIRYQLPDLERKLREYPVNVNITTEIIVVKEKLKRPFKDMFHGYSKNPITFCRQLKPILRVTRFTVSLMVVRRFRDEWIIPHFQYSGAQRDNPILLKCSLSLNCDILNMKKEFEKKYTFPYAKIQDIPIFLPWCGMKLLRMCSVEFDMRFSEMSFENLAETNVYTPKLRDYSIFNDLSLIGRELLQLYENRDECDLIIEVGHQKFFGHRSFLANRNELIEKKLKSLENGLQGSSAGLMTIRLDGIEPHMCDAILAYLYSGRVIVDLNDSEKANDFRNAVNYFGLPEILFSELFGYRTA